MKRKELLFIILILVLAGGGWAAMQLLNGGAKSEITISVDGETYGIYSLSQDQVISINDSNVCEIKDHEVRMISADCPDQLCIHQLPIGSNGGLIVCLPNRVVISGSTGGDVKYASENDKTDAVAQ